MSRPLPFWHYLLVLLSVNGLLFAILALISYNGFPGLLDSDSFLFADANHYREIQATGYRGVNIAFFPLTPYLWRFLGLGVYGILAFHGLLFGAFSVWMASEFRFSLLSFAFACTLPNVFFLIFPWSEAVFFVGGAMVLVGLHKDRFWLLLAGLMWCTLTRPAFTVFFPALLIVEYVRGPLDRKALLRILGYACVFALGAAIVAWVQSLDTGAWFKFFGVQSAWGNYLQVPTLPLRTWGGREALLLDAGALVGGMAAMRWVLKRLGSRLRGQFAKFSPALVFSFCYLAGITFAVILFRGGSLFSLNRFVFATPFAFVIVHYFWGLRGNENHHFQVNWRHILAVFVGLELFFFLFRSYVHLEILLCFTGVAVYFTLLTASLLPTQRIAKTSFVIAMLMQFGYLVYACFRLLTGNWIA
jgi:hypothetical protein